MPIADAAATPYERRYLYVHDPDAAPPRMLHEVAAILGRCREAQARRRAAAHRRADELGALLARPDAENTAVAAALQACGLPPGEGPYRVITANTGARSGGPADGALEEGALTEGALAEAVAHLAGPGPAAVGRLPDRTAFAVVPGPVTLDGVWALVAACEPSIPLHGGTGAPAAGPRDLAGALTEARYGLVSA
ncbi:hypothetical protein [Streptomyces sp. NPDC127119]|uniref:hypothetical protein n=1 Tax=Streptomyces sp. NPDC127119 TaxID=3345370 RepID=UPI00362A283B